MMNKNIYNSNIVEEIIGEITPDEFTKTEKRMLLAARIDEAIKSKGWKKNQFAEAIGRRPSEVSKWLTGTHNFTADTLFEIERVLDIQLFKLELKKEGSFDTSILMNILSEHTKLFDDQAKKNIYQNYLKYYWFVSKPTTFNKRVSLIGNKLKDVHYTEEVY